MLQSSPPEAMPHPIIWWAARCNHLYPKLCHTPLFGGRHVAVISTRSHAPPPYLVGGTLQSSPPEAMPHPPIWWAARCNHLHPKPCPTPYLVGGTLQSSPSEAMPHPLFGVRHVATISTRSHAPPPYLVGGTLQSSPPEAMPHPSIQVGTQHQGTKMLL